MKLNVYVLVHTRGERTNNDGLADLHARRFANWSETARNLTINEALLKDITDGLEIPKRVSRKHEHPINVRTTFTLLADTNHRPKLSVKDGAVWNRLVYFETRPPVPKDEQIEGLARSIFDDEAAGILQWAMRGCVDWQKKGGGLKGLAVPFTMEQAIARYQSSEDRVKTFISDHLIAEPERAKWNVNPKTLRDLYNEPLEKPVPLGEFKKVMAENDVNTADTDSVPVPEAGKAVRVLKGWRWADDANPWEKGN